MVGPCTAVFGCVALADGSGGVKASGPMGTGARKGHMNIWKRVRGIVASAVLMTSAVAGFGEAPARDTAGPALWKVADADTTIYLFGTMHILPDKANWRTEPVAEAISNSDTLV